MVIYLSFFMFMAAARTLLLKAGVIEDLALVSFIVTAVGVLGPVLLFWMVRKTPLSFLFRRPQALRIPATPTRFPPKACPGRDPGLLDFGDKEARQKVPQPKRVSSAPGRLEA